MTDREHAFNFYFRMYVNDLTIAEAYINAPQCFPHIDTAELQWEMETAWNHLEQLIPEEHIQAIDDLLYGM